MAAPLDDEEDALLKEDFYALFNVSREATKEEINAAYKQMSRIYHPDKHQDPDKKKNAEVVSRVKTPAEIIAEYERIKRDEEEKRLQRQTNPQSSVMRFIIKRQIGTGLQQYIYTSGTKIRSWDVERQKQEQQEKMQEKKTNAESMVELMKETVERITEAEERKNGLIIITASDLPGFYDPCYGEDKKLYIKYKFRKKLHHTTLNDQDSIRLPQQIFTNCV
ncbi:DJC11-like protein [Mya arenaria]|uniref:DJC11-like protein n=1 Tax=Mya arenaria TaxID=6604 RepID=A0ABY7EV35_MYAAR|nr:DJC11-like protein [Mya arenaria]